MNGATKPAYKLLTAPSDPKFTSEVRSSVATFVEKKQITIEHAGKAFHAFQRRASGLTWEVEKKKKDAPKAAAPVRVSTPASEKESDDDEDLMFKGLKDDKDYYALLGISHLGLNASDKQVKKGYQEMILKTHPDKIKSDATPAETAAANALFRDVQLAYEVLSDVEKRRGYDSQFEFDDTIPTGFETLKDENAFYALYGPVFEMNARFSTVKPVPLLGSSDDDEATVKAMYNFWRGFRSWRDFSAFDEFKDGDIETAEGRDHRRHMQKKNEAQRDKRKKAEFVRIQSLVDRAFKNDPRIAKFKADVENKKREVVQARENAKKAIEDAKKAEEEKIERENAEKAKADSEKREADKKAKKNVKQARNKAMKALTAKLGELKMEENTVLLEHDVLSTLEADQLSELLAKVEAANDTEPFVSFCRQVRCSTPQGAREEEARQRKQEEMRKLEAQAAQVAKEKAEEKARRTLIWTTDAMSYLAKGMAKHPGGTRNRWQCISDFVATSGFQQTADDCIEASKKLAAGGPATKPSVLVTGGAIPAAADLESEEKQEVVKEWSTEEQKVLEAALREYPNTMEINERWTAIAAKVGTRSKKECAARVKDLKAKAQQD